MRSHMRAGFLQVSKWAKHDKKNACCDCRSGENSGFAVVNSLYKPGTRVIFCAVLRTVYCSTPAYDQARTSVTTAVLLHVLDTKSADRSAHSLASTAAPRIYTTQLLYSTLVRVLTAVRTSTAAVSVYSPHGWQEIVCCPRKFF